MESVSAPSRMLVSGAAERLAALLRPGRVYRREDLAEMSNAVDRHVRELVAEASGLGITHADLDQAFKSETGGRR